MSDSSFFSHLEPDEIERKLKRIPMFIRMTSWGKMAIGATLLVIVMWVILVPLLTPDEDGMRIALTQVEPTQLAEKPIMRNPRFTSVDGSDQPYTIRAKDAVQQSETQIVLNHISADVTLNSGLWLALSAQKGELDIQDQKLQLMQDVQVIASNGYELRTPSAFVDMKRGMAKGTEGISGQGPIGNIKAYEFLIESDTSRVLFEKDVTLTLYP